MKNILLFIAFLSCAQAVLGQGISCQLPQGTDPQRTLSILQEKFSATAGQYLDFKHIKSDIGTGTFSTETRTFKLKRKTARIGEFPQVHRPRWKKEKVQLKANLKDGILKVELNASVYNSRDKKWYPVHSTGRYEETILEGVLTAGLEGVHGKTMGSPSASGNNGMVKLRNLQSFTITGAYVSLNDVKTLVVDLTDKNGVTCKVSIPFLAQVDTICNAVKSFFSRFTTRDLKSEVSRTYDYYWAYALEGELMDGMHQNQVLTALGEPDEKVQLGKATEKWTYRTGNQICELIVANGELHLSENPDS
ncbi:MAG: hypothetical protein KAH24_03110 [Holophagae bacterium]|nr:hypothetical protein [Holophagae bacterium]